ncbi:hypothetical protein C8Q78DRAFT_762485 [Trametes maxima]|nr:hypothetical protein C8Q78DRAFT_762485 [Trametes maxima]
MGTADDVDAYILSFEYKRHTFVRCGGIGPNCNRKRARRCTCLNDTDNLCMARLRNIRPVAEHLRMADDPVAQSNSLPSASSSPTQLDGSLTKSPGGRGPLRPSSRVARRADKIERLLATFQFLSQFPPRRLSPSCPMPYVWPSSTPTTSQNRPTTRRRPASACSRSPDSSLAALSPRSSSAGPLTARSSPALSPRRAAPSRPSAQCPPKTPSTSRSHCHSKACGCRPCRRLAPSHPSVAAFPHRQSRFRLSRSPATERKLEPGPAPSTASVGPAMGR